MGIYGRRKPEEPAELPKYLIPPELWDDPKIGEMLKMLGKKPDDPENLTLTPEHVERMIASGKARILQKTRAINDEIAAKGARNARVKPFWLIQENCWVGDLGHFLIFVLRLNPYDDWNVVYLPENETGSAILDLPVHPGGAIPVFADYGEKNLRTLQARLMEALAEAEASFAFGDYADAQQQTIDNVKQLAEYFSALLVEAHDTTKRKHS
jgi:hypothetical protein